MTSLLSTIPPVLYILCSLIFIKVLDKVPHNKLMFKVKQLEIEGNVHNWIKKKKKKKKLAKQKKEWLSINQPRTGHQSLMASPQGSVLEPVLFIIYINDIDIRFHNFIAKFAGDTKIGNLIISDRDRQSLQEDLCNISTWFDGWEMPFNVNKCHIPQMRTRNKKY